MKYNRKQLIDILEAKKADIEAQKEFYKQNSELRTAQLTEWATAIVRGEIEGDFSVDEGYRGEARIEIKTKVPDYIIEAKSPDLYALRKIDEELAWLKLCVDETVAIRRNSNLASILS